MDYPNCTANHLFTDPAAYSISASPGNTRIADLPKIFPIRNAGPPTRARNQHMNLPAIGLGVHFRQKTPIV